MRLAIDFGTTNSVLAAWDAQAGVARLLEIPALSQDTASGRPPLIPSLLYVQDGQRGQVILGQAVRSQGLDRRRDQRLFRNFKRGMLVAEGKEPRLVDSAPWSDYDAGLHFLKGLLQAQPYPPGQIDQLVLTVPVAAFDDYLNWLNQHAGGELLAENVQLVDESTAAALGYAITSPGELVLVIDFGGGSLDISLVQLPERRVRIGAIIKRLGGRAADTHTARVIAKAGLNLGGSDMDHWLLTEALLRAGLQLSDLGDDYAPLLTACENAKIDLSNAPTTAVAFEAAGQDYRFALTRQEFENILRGNGLFDSMQRALEKVLHVAQRQGIFKEDIRHVLLTGGTALIPSVQAALREYFSPEIVRVEKPFTAVVEGALQIAAGLGVQDHLVHGYGLRCFDRASGTVRYDEILAPGSPYPSPKPVEVRLAAAFEVQPQVEFVIGQVELDAVSSVEVRYENGQAVFVASAATTGDDTADFRIIPVNAATPPQVTLEPPGQPGVQRLAASFSIDSQRQLRLTVNDLQTGRELIHETVLAVLGEGLVGFQELSAEVNRREPALASTPQRSEQRLSLRRLGTLLNLLPPEAISLSAVEEALKSDQFYVRYEAASLLARRGGRDARLLYERLLKTGSGPQRAAMARHLHHFSWFTAEPLLRQSLDDPDRRVREAAVYALCETAALPAYNLLQNALQTPDSETLKSAAAWGLARRPSPDALPAYRAILTAADPEVRAQALELLAAAGDPTALPAVISALDDPEPDVQYAAALSWIELENEGCFPALADRMKTAPGPARRVLILALFHATNYLGIRIAHSSTAGTILDALQICLNDPDPEIRMTAFKTLAWTQDPRAVPFLESACQAEIDPDLRLRCLYLASSLYPPVGTDLAHHLRSDPDAAVRALAEQILQRSTV